MSWYLRDRTPAEIAFTDKMNRNLNRIQGICVIAQIALVLGIYSTDTSDLINKYFFWLWPWNIVIYDKVLSSSDTIEHWSLFFASNSMLVVLLAFATIIHTYKYYKNFDLGSFRVFLIALLMISLLIIHLKLIDPDQLFNDRTIFPNLGLYRATVYNLVVYTPYILATHYLVITVTLEALSRVLAPSKVRIV